MLPDDVWRQVGLHLKPRHLVKLMATSKHIFSIVDNENYWARVAFHLIWREVYEMEFVLVCEEQVHCLQLPIFIGDPYYLSCVYNGYKWAIDQIFARVDQCAEIYPEQFSFWNTAKHLSTSDQVIMSCQGLRSMYVYLPSEIELTKSMKEIVQCFFERASENKSHMNSRMLREKSLRQAREEIDDIQMSISTKRKIVGIIQDLYSKLG